MFPGVDSWLIRCSASVFVTAAFGLNSWGDPAHTPAPVQFNRDIRPILADHCYACHGPDQSKRKAGLRLDREEEVFKPLKSGERALVPGDLKASALIQRITAADPDDLMPPPKHNKPLSAAQIELLKRWVEQGATWQKHWSFIPPERPPLPHVDQSQWPRNGIDYFTQARLEKEHLSPNPEADKTTLLRRLTFDLTGLPPSIEEVDAFLLDNSPDAYERQVDRLLDSPHYGERMAQNWMDLARYADTAGYHFDGIRFMWLWRDWVIRAFNENKPYDAFTVEQLAGDLLPNPTQGQRIATGFVRNNMTNDEGGADPDEYLDKYVADRVNTVGAVWMGLTIGCAQCHDHKYDPLPTKDFYSMYAFFHNVPEKGLDRIRTDNPPPRLPVPTEEQARRFVEADFAFKDAEKTLQDRVNELGETQEKWERETDLKQVPQPPENGLVSVLPLDRSLAFEPGASAQEAEMVGREGPELVPGRLGKALKLGGQSHVAFATRQSFDLTNTFSYGAWVKPESDGAVLSKMEKGPSERGFDVFYSGERFEVHLVHTWPDEALKVRTKERFSKGQWAHVFVTYDGASKAAGVKLYVNGRAREVDVEKEKLADSIANDEPVRLGARRDDSQLKGLIDDVRIYDRVLTADEVRWIAFQPYRPILAKSRGHRTDEERADLQRFYKDNFATDYLRSDAAFSQARKNKEAFYSEIPTTMIMEELAPARETFVLVRGDYRHKGERVWPGTPTVLPPLPPGSSNRLALARWLVSKENPLTARVTVNRYWAMFFGTGLVKTINDFGSQGEWPSHPELLDWLAVQFRDGGTEAPPPGAPSAGPWDVKGLVRLMVTSATYRQSAVVTPEKLQRDPYNRLFTRGPRLRLDAEFIRDNALAVAGLLDTQVGGPSVKPYQPPGIWDGVDAKYEQDKGEALYRRGLYVYWRRSAHYPSFATFDAPSREVCTFLRQRTQTPLQSLVLMNDPAYVEAARGLAERVIREEPASLHGQLYRAFRHTLGRVPQQDELNVLHKTYDEELAHFTAEPDAANAFLKVGEAPVPKEEAAPQLAALTAVANVLLNLNETITR